jgi:hypothetical protein
LAKVILQFIEPDGTYMLRGLRVRAAPGVGMGPGTLVDEASRDVRTPLDSEEARKVILGLCGPELKPFVRSLPAVAIAS